MKIHKTLIFKDSKQATCHLGFNEGKGWRVLQPLFFFFFFSQDANPISISVRI
jgi:hypothetical protein